MTLHSSRPSYTTLDLQAQRRIIACKEVVMSSLRVRDLPDDVHEALVRSARAENRSIAQQAVVELRKALDLPVNQPARRRALLNRLAGEHRVDWVELGDPVGLVREDRER